MASSETQGLDNSPRVRRTIQAILDLCKGDVEDLRILDLGCAHGLYTLDLASRGANTVGLEGRAGWLVQANATRDIQGIQSAKFVHGDARNISSDAYGQFDVSLCLGLLYHLEAEEAYSLLASLRDMTRDFIVVDTQVALVPTEKRTLGGKEYFGHTFPEHAPGASAEAMEAELGSSLDRNFSFWFTLASLTNLLGEIGFSTVFEIKWPTDHLFKDGEFKVLEDYVTLVAVKGKRVENIFGLILREGPAERAPEDRSAFFLQRPWSGSMQDDAASPKPNLADSKRDMTHPPPLRARLAAAARALRGLDPYP